MIANKVTPYAHAREGQGRPSKYRPEHCALVIAMGCSGASLSEMARQIGVSRSRLYDWEQRNPEFRDAIARARTASLAWWEDFGQQGLVNPQFNAAAWAFEMCRRFPRDYSRNPKAEIPSARLSSRNPDVMGAIERCITGAAVPIHKPIPTSAGQSCVFVGIGRAGGNQWQT